MRGLDGREELKEECEDGVKGGEGETDGDVGKRDKGGGRREG